MGGKGGDGGASNYNAGYSGWTQGSQMHEQGAGDQYYAAGWKARQSEWDQQQSFMTMMEDLTSPNYSADEMGYNPSYVPWSDKNAGFDDLSKYYSESTTTDLAEDQMFVWDVEEDTWQRIHKDDWTKWREDGAEYAYDSSGKSYGEGKEDRADLYGEYLKAGESATDVVNDRIITQGANAALIGVEYKMTDDIKNNMISKEFGKLWGADEQSRLEELMGRWGNPEGFEDWLFTRIEEDLPPEDTGAQASQATQGGPSGITLLTEDDENKYALGGA